MCYSLHLTALSAKRCSQNIIGSGQEYQFSRRWTVSLRRPSKPAVPAQFVVMTKLLPVLTKLWLTWIQHCCHTTIHQHQLYLHLQQHHHQNTSGLGYRFTYQAWWWWTQSQPPCHTPCQPHLPTIIPSSVNLGYRFNFQVRKWWWTHPLVLMKKVTALHKLLHLGLTEYWNS